MTRLPPGTGVVRFTLVPPKMAKVWSSTSTPSGTLMSTPPNTATVSMTTSSEVHTASVKSRFNPPNIANSFIVDGTAHRPSSDDPLNTPTRTALTGVPGIATGAEWATTTGVYVTLLRSRVTGRRSSYCVALRIASARCSCSSVVRKPCTCAALMRLSACWRSSSVTSRCPPYFGPTSVGSMLMQPG